MILCFSKDKYGQIFVENVNEIELRKKETNSSTRSSYLITDVLKDTEKLFQNENSQEFNNSICSRSDYIIKYFINKRWKYVYKEEMKVFERLK